MPIWELKPTDKNSGCWRASSYKGRVVVRTANESKARDFATSKFHIAPRRVAGDTPVNPWIQSDLVTCRPLDDSPYDDNGPDETLEPA